MFVTSVQNWWAFSKILLIRNKNPVVQKVFKLKSQRNSKMSNSENLNIHEMKRNPIFMEVNVERGHPEIAVDNLTGKLEDLGFEVERGPSSITNDDIADGVKDYKEYVEASRTEKRFRKNAKEYKRYSLIGLGVTTLLLLISILQRGFIALFLISLIATIVVYILSRPTEIKDNVYIWIVGKVYAGTKARETRDSDKQKAGTTRLASTTYVHSEVKFILSGDSEISVDRLRKDIGTISKYLQKI
ncbi:hypothetical protein KAT36_02245 [Candidatus Pacearchaeota archaeon]|nr:hypothetical protein [Candidatus Pacearchaeota archaeon]